MKPHEILQESKRDAAELANLRHFLHQHPETGFDLKETYSYVKKQLEAIGLEPLPCGKAGLVVTVGGHTPGKVFLLRADLDALPITEEAEIDFPSQNKNMHACGHDMHTAMLLGAAKILKAHEKEIKGTVKLMFQPAEEIFEGSKDMLANGVLENPAVDAGLMIHVMAGMPFPVGTAIVCDGGVSAPAADYFTIRIQGKGCHGSMPWQGIDPITAAAHIIIALQEIAARELPLSDDAVLTIGSIYAGDAANAIPDTARLSGTIRTYNEEVRKHLKSRITEIATHTATALRAGAIVEFGSGCPTLLNDSALSECTLKYIQELHGTQMVFTAAQLAAAQSTATANTAKAATKPSKSAGSEDFAYISQEIPTIMVALAAGQPKEGYSYPQHHPKVKFDDAALPYGAAIYAYTAMRWLEEH